MADSNTSVPQDEERDDSNACCSVVNVNIGVLGHVDSGKTSLVRVLSTHFSTASLDKHPQSKERGITLDLGFSAFTTDVPAHIQSETNADKLQYTLVDCPGHASLIRTIIGGAQIIDRMILVVDVTKGIQTQTAECLVIGEILTNDLIIVLNKVDLIQGDEYESRLNKIKTALQAALKSTRFKNAPMIPVAAKVGGDGKAGVGQNSDNVIAETVGLQNLVDLIRSTTRIPQRAHTSSALFMSVDHCFPIKGKGTVMTGTVMSGTVSVGDTIELPDLSMERKVKSIQMFRRSVDNASQGDRCAVLVKDLNAKLVERGLVVSPNSVKKLYGAVALVRKVKYFQRPCHSNSKIHITIGHSTVVGTVTFFGGDELKGTAKALVGKQIPPVEFDTSKDWKYDDELRAGGKSLGGPMLQWALIVFETPCMSQDASMVIGSRLDLDINIKSCRIAFYGRIATALDADDLENLSTYKVFKTKERECVIDRVTDERNVIVKNLLSKESDMTRVIGLKVYTKDRSEGRIESSFGKTGKLKVYFPDGVNNALKKGEILRLPLKRYVFAPQEEKKKLVQE